jgi:hypothetical protein
MKSKLYSVYVVTMDSLYGKIEEPIWNKLNGLLNNHRWDDFVHELFYYLWCNRFIYFTKTDIHKYINKWKKNSSLPHLMTYIEKEITNDHYIARASNMFR